MGGNCLSCVHACDGLSSVNNQWLLSEMDKKWKKGTRRKIGWEACSLKKYFTGGHPLEEPSLMFSIVKVARAQTQPGSLLSRLGRKMRDPGNEVDSNPTCIDPLKQQTFNG